LSIIQGPLSVAPCQTLISQFATFSSPYDETSPIVILRAGGVHPRPTTSPRGCGCLCWRVSSIQCALPSVCLPKNPTLPPACHSGLPSCHHGCLLRPRLPASPTSVSHSKPSALLVAPNTGVRPHLQPRHADAAHLVVLADAPLQAHPGTERRVQIVPAHPCPHPHPPGISAARSMGRRAVLSTLVELVSAVSLTQLVTPHPLSFRGGCAPLRHGAVPVLLVERHEL
jgi:hypothetical protein